MSRVDLFAGIHKALRWASARAVDELAACGRDSTATLAALAHLRELFAMQRIHQRVEDTFVIPAIEARKPGAAARLVEAHADHADSLREMEAMISEIERDPTERGMHALYLEVTRWVADNFLHMYEEETLAQPLLDEIYSHEELAAIATRARTSVAPDEATLFVPAMRASGGLSGSGPADSDANPRS